MVSWDDATDEAELPTIRPAMKWDAVFENALGGLMTTVAVGAGVYFWTNRKDIIKAIKTKRPKPTPPAKPEAERETTRHVLGLFLGFFSSYGLVWYLRDWKPHFDALPIVWGLPLACLASSLVGIRTWELIQKNKPGKLDIVVMIFFVVALYLGLACVAYLLSRPTMPEDVAF
jgi:hypothetical protein